MIGRRPIVVTGVGGPAGRSLVRQLVERSFDVVGVDIAPVELPGAHFALVPPASDPAFAEELREVAATSRAHLIIPTVTEELVVPGLGTGRGWPAVVRGPQFATAVAADKWLTCRQLAAAGVPVPHFALPSRVRTPKKRGGVLGLPYLSKPRRSRGGRGVVVHARGDSAMVDCLADDTILQEFVPGQEYAVNLFIAADSDHDVVVVLAKTLLAQGQVGNALAVQRVDEPAVAEVARKAAKAIGLTGPTDIDVRRRVCGEPVILELNARFGAHSAHAPEILDAVLAEHLPRVRALSGRMC